MADDDEEFLRELDSYEDAPISDDDAPLLKGKKKKPLSQEDAKAAEDDDNAPLLNKKKPKKKKKKMSERLFPALANTAEVDQAWLAYNTYLFKENDNNDKKNKRKGLANEVRMVNELNGFMFWLRTETMPKNQYDPTVAGYKWSETAAAASETYAQRMKLYKFLYDCQQTWLSCGDDKTNCSKAFVASKKRLAKAANAPARKRLPFVPFHMFVAEYATAAIPDKDNRKAYALNWFTADPAKVAADKAAGKKPRAPTMATASKQIIVGDPAWRTAAERFVDFENKTTNIPNLPKDSRDCYELWAADQKPPHEPTPELITKEDGVTVTIDVKSLEAFVARDVRLREQFLQLSDQDRAKACLALEEKEAKRQEEAGDEPNKKPGKKQGKKKKKGENTNKEFSAKQLLQRFWHLAFDSDDAEDKTIEATKEILAKRKRVASNKKTNNYSMSQVYSVWVKADDDANPMQDVMKAIRAHMAKYASDYAKYAQMFKDQKLKKLCYLRYYLQNRLADLEKKSAAAAEEKKSEKKKNGPYVSRVTDALEFDLKQLEAWEDSEAEKACTPETVNAKKLVAQIRRLRHKIRNVLHGRSAEDEEGEEGEDEEEKKEKKKKKKVSALPHFPSLFWSPAGPFNVFYSPTKPLFEKVSEKEPEAVYQAFSARTLYPKSIVTPPAFKALSDAIKAKPSTSTLKDHRMWLAALLKFYKWLADSRTTQEPVFWKGLSEDMKRVVIRYLEAVWTVEFQKAFGTAKAKTVTQEQVDRFATATSEIATTALTNLIQELKSSPENKQQLEAAAGTINKNDFLRSAIFRYLPELNVNPSEHQKKKNQMEAQKEAKKQARKKKGQKNKDGGSEAKLRWTEGEKEADALWREEEESEADRLSEEESEVEAAAEAVRRADEAAVRWEEDEEEAEKEAIRRGEEESDTEAVRRAEEERRLRLGPVIPPPQEDEEEEEPIQQQQPVKKPAPASSPRVTRASAKKNKSKKQKAPSATKTNFEDALSAILAAKKYKNLRISEEVKNELQQGITSRKDLENKVQALYDAQTRAAAAYFDDWKALSKTNKSLTPLRNKFVQAWLKEGQEKAYELLSEFEQRN